MNRVLISASAVQGDRITIRDPAELHHLVRVRRVRVGEPLECLDGEGHRYTGRVIQTSATRVIVAVDRREAAAPAIQVTLALALIKADRFEWAIEKTTELGVARLVPLIAARSIVKVRAEDAERKRIRWQRIAAEAAKQCGLATLPVMEPPRPYASFAASLEAGALLATLAVPAVPLAEPLRAARGQVTVLIGPEGDFTDEEARLALRRGAVAVSLGLRTLRSETAAVAALAMVRYHQMINEGTDS